MKKRLGRKRFIKRKFRSRQAIERFLGEKTYSRQFVTVDHVDLPVTNGATTFLYSWHSTNSAAKELIIPLCVNQDFLATAGIYEFFKLYAVKIQLSSIVSPTLIGQQVVGTVPLGLPPISVSLDFDSFPTVQNNYKYVGTDLRMQILETSPKPVSRFYKLPLIQGINTSDGILGNLGPVWMDAARFAGAGAGGATYVPNMYLTLGMAEVGALSNPSTGNATFQLVEVTVTYYTKWAKRI